MPLLISSTNDCWKIRPSTTSSRTPTYQGYKRHQVLLISQVLGGPAEYSGRELGQAHEGLNITNDDFHHVVAHLVDVLRKNSVDEDIIGRVGEALGAAEKDIVEAS